MGTSKYGYKNLFKEWINEVITLKARKEELEEKLNYLKTSLFSCSGISYDSIRTSKTNFTNDRMIEMLSRIEDVEKNLQEINLKLIPYNSLVFALSPRENEVLEICVIKKIGPQTTARILKISRNNVYLILNNIIQKCENKFS